MRPHFLALLAEALAKARKFGEALHVLEEALSMVLRNGERCYEAELLRLKGELLLMQSAGRAVSIAARSGRAAVETESASVTNAIGCFGQSIMVAQQQQAKSLELRAVMCVARLYKNQGRQDEAWSLLAQIYDQFTEGFDTKDLLEAKVLLDELSQSNRLA